MTDRFTRINHIGIAVTDLKAAIVTYEKILGVPCSGVEEVPSQKVRAAFFLLGESRIELLEPTAPDSPISKFLAKSGGGIHHICFENTSAGEALARLGREGVQLIDREARPGAGGCQVGFVHPKATHGVLLEVSTEPSGGAHHDG